MKHHSRQENWVHIALWGILFVSPLLSYYIHHSGQSDHPFYWDDVFNVWQEYAVFLAIYLVHNFLLAPLLIYKRRRWLYFSVVGVIVALFTVFQCVHQPEFKRDQRDRELADHRRPDVHPDDPQMFQPPMPMERMEERAPRHEARPHPPVGFGQREMMSVIFLVLILGMNLGIKLYFKSRSDAKRLERLEHENLEQQLEYLKYQINPHFFMNTLNNIHALVDIDPEKAKDSIVELSKMMRYVLYEGDKTGVPLDREFDFIGHYVTLMRLRYTDRVQITVQLPETVPSAKLPPLMLVTFVENAFKHGISYQHDSFIHIQAEISGDRLHFSCRNSQPAQPVAKTGGVGLTNARKRLSLTYGTDYRLDIQNEPDTYSVTLDIPLLHS